MSGVRPEKERPRIIYKRRKSKGGGHHGGSWKVAYADFVTAMMAFFLVMWIVGLDESVKHNISGYFNDPYGREGVPAGSIVPAPGTAPGGQMAIIPLTADHKTEADIFEKVKERIEQALLENDAFVGMREFVEIRVTEEGLVIEMMDSEESFFFERSSAVVKPAARQLFAVIAAEIGRLPNPIVFEGHTDRTAFRPGASYTNWELSADRANAVRRIMGVHGVGPEQTAEVRGYGATELRRPDSPAHFSNRRVSILARYSEP